MTSDVTLSSLTLNSPNATINHNGGWLEVSTLNIQAGNYNLQYGNIRNATIQDHGGTGQLVVWSTKPTLDHVTLGMDMSLPYDSQVAIRNGLTLANRNFRFISGSFVYFYDSQPLGGTGEVIVDVRPDSSGYYTTNLYAPSGTFIIGPSVTVRDRRCGWAKRLRRMPPRWS